MSSWLKSLYSSFIFISIGTTLYFLGITGNNVSGASLNPARSISPAIIMEFMGDNKPIKQLWLYIISPILGGISAGYVAKLFEWVY